MEAHQGFPVNRSSDQWPGMIHLRDLFPWCNQERLLVLQNSPIAISSRFLQVTPQAAQAPPDSIS